MFQNQRSGSGVLLLGMGVLLAVWLAAAGLMVKSFQEGGDTAPTCQMICNHVTPAISRG